MPKTTIAHPRRSISASTKKKREELLAETLSPLPVQSRAGSCPPDDDVWTIVASLVPAASADLSDARSRVHLLDQGDRYEIRVTPVDKTTANERYTTQSATAIARSPRGGVHRPRPDAA